ncbi:MAG: molybdate ABC transporter substrate-binding protein [Pseudohongiellaceae bacterium]
MRHSFRRLALLFAALVVQGAAAEEILIAAASNFAAPMTELVQRFEQDTGHEVELAFGSSGRFYAQISNGAPFQVFFSADQDKPAQLEADGLAVPGTRFTYALGSLVLWTADSARAVVGPESLTSVDYRRLALANPRLAPYGQAAVQVLEALDLDTATRAKWVQGENIAQTFQFVSTGNAELGFVAMSQVAEDGRISSGSGWIVPQDLHSPIRQDVVLLQNAAGCRACRDFLAFARGAQARAIITSYGYRLE